ncbi:MAG: AAA family ATPase, partial [Dehalococcoidia bacterium]
GAGAADIAEVVSDVKDRLPDLKPPPQLDSPEQARFRLFDSITAFLKSASQKQPLVLVLDDLHWADQPSLLLLQVVARELGNSRLLLLGTYRDVELNRQHPLAETLGELTRERLFQRVLLRGLSQQDVGRFIEVAAGVDPPSGLTEAVHTQTEGNPLFVTEVVRLLVQEGELNQESGARDSWTVRIPEGVREVIGRRLNRLSQRCNETLTIASVIGREFELRELAPLVEDVSEDRLLEVLEEALSARVIEELPQVVGRYQFTHALIRETLTEELTLTRRARLHARIGDVLEELYGDEVEGHAAELAYHFVEAVAVIGRSKLVRYSLLAGERALATYAHEEAIAHFERALAAKEGQPMDAETAALLSGLGRAQIATLPLYQLQEAVVTLSRAFDYYAEVGDVDRAVAVAENPLPAAAGHFTGAGQLIARVVALVKPDSLEMGRLQSSYGRILSLEEGDYPGAKLALDQALAIARREGDVGLEMRTLVSAAEVEGYHNRWQESLERSLRAIELIPRIDDPRTEMLAHYWATLPLMVLGEPNEADLHAAAMLSPSERLRHHFYLARSLFAHTCLAQCRGSWQAAREFSDRGLAVSPREARLLGNRLILEYELGDFSLGQVYLERLLEVVQLTASGPTLEHAFLAAVIPVVARITGSSSRFDVAEAAAETILSSPSVTP